MHQICLALVLGFKNGTPEHRVDLRLRDLDATLGSIVSLARLVLGIGADEREIVIACGSRSDGQSCKGDDGKEFDNGLIHLNPSTPRAPQDAGRNVTNVLQGANGL